jgi:hypothetical protein
MGLFLQCVYDSWYERSSQWFLAIWVHNLKLLPYECFLHAWEAHQRYLGELDGLDCMWTHQIWVTLFGLFIDCNPIGHIFITTSLGFLSSLVFNKHYPLALQCYSISLPLLNKTPQKTIQSVSVHLPLCMCLAEILTWVIPTNKRTCWTMRCEDEREWLKAW